MLTKEYGPFAKQKSQKVCQYWHYGKEYGSQIIKKLKKKKHKNRSLSSGNHTVNSSSDED